MRWLTHPPGRRRILWLGIGVAALYWLSEAALHLYVFEDGDILAAIVPRNPNELWMRSLIAILLIGYGFYGDAVLEQLRRSEQARAVLQAELEERLTRVLGGFLPICGYCKNIRREGGDPNDRDAWNSIESYIATHSDVRFSHGVCPDCMRRHFPEAAQRR